MGCTSNPLGLCQHQEECSRSAFITWLLNEIANQVNINSDLYFLHISEYSEWIDVPARNSTADTAITEITEGLKFQIRTSAALTSTNVIRCLLTGSSDFFTIDGSTIKARFCGYSLAGNEGFLSTGGILTFLKSTTQLLVWFDDVLEVTWAYEDKSASQICQMRSPMTALSFHLLYDDTASVQYRYTFAS